MRTTSALFLTQNGSHLPFGDHLHTFSQPKWSSSTLSRPFHSLFPSKLVLTHSMTTTSSLFSLQNGPHSLYYSHSHLFSPPKWSSSATKITLPPNQNTNPPLYYPLSPPSSQKSPPSRDPSPQSARSGSLS